MNKNVLVSWSGGKDSCLACYRAVKQGYRMQALMNFISKEYKRCCFHGVEAGLIQGQSDLMGIPLIQHEVTADMKTYEQEFKAAVGAVVGVQGMVFGDIYLDEHRDWVERVCRDVKLSAIEPLWSESPAALAEEFVDAGFKAVVVSCQSAIFNRDFVGRFFDKKMIAELIARNICPCGENGEFHTLVIDGPLFKNGNIEILESRAVLKKGFWESWFLDIQKYRIRQCHRDVQAVY